jgi:predicted phosphodiesterase
MLSGFAICDVRNGYGVRLVYLQGKAAVVGAYILEIQDLGELSGDIVVFGGVYSNLQALQAFVGWFEDARIPSENCICTGDIVAYCANPAEVTQLMIDREITSIAGNCEKQLATGAEDCGCGFDEGTVCDLASKGWFPFAKAKTAQFQGFYAGLPDVIKFSAFGKVYVVIHGGITDISRFLWPVSEAGEFKAEIRVLEDILGPIDGIIAGHSGIAFEREINGKSWINAGVIGMPPHDGRAKTRFAVLSETGVRFHHLEYDAKAAAEAMKGAGLVQGYERSLSNGVWPSEDILPQPLRR